MKADLMLLKSLSQTSESEAQVLILKSGLGFAIMVLKNGLTHALVAQTVKWMNKQNWKLH